MLEYLTSLEIAEKWGISSRRVTTLCKQGRVEGAISKGNTWLIPDDTPKPEERLPGRRKQGTYPE